MPVPSDVEGPAWCKPGLDVRGGRYPLAVESAVLRMVDKLVPGVSTLSRQARYFSLYWAIADLAERTDLDAGECKLLIRRAEVALAWLSIWDPSTGTLDGPGVAHAAAKVRSMITKGSATAMTAEGAGSYSPRPWGFWSQYGGPCVTLGSVALKKRALRPGQVQCPREVSDLFAPLLEICVERAIGASDLPGLGDLTSIDASSVDAEPLRMLLVSSAAGGEPNAGNRETRRAAFRLVGRSAQLCNDSHTTSWTSVCRAVLAYGDSIDTDPVLCQEARAQAWRGTLLRHRFVAAWRILWSELVGFVWNADHLVTRDHLHQWIRASVGSSTVLDFTQSLPDTCDAAGYPRDAESELLTTSHSLAAQIGVLVLGARRDDELSGVTLNAFRGGDAQTRQFLDPKWMSFQLDDHIDQTLGDLACAVLEDMLSQSRRVALRKTRIGPDGHLTTFTKLHQREGFYFATGQEGRGNVGLRIDQLGALAEQLGLLSVTGGQPPEVTDLGRIELDI